MLPCCSLWFISLTCLFILLCDTHAPSSFLPPSLPAILPPQGGGHGTSQGGRSCHSEWGVFVYHAEVYKMCAAARPSVLRSPAIPPAKETYICRKETYHAAHMRSRFCCAPSSCEASHVTTHNNILLSKRDLHTSQRDLLYSAHSHSHEQPPSLLTITTLTTPILKPTRQRRPTTCQKRPTTRQKRPITCQKRSTTRPPNNLPSLHPSPPPCRALLFRQKKKTEGAPQPWLRQ